MPGVRRNDNAKNLKKSEKLKVFIHSSSTTNDAVFTVYWLLIHVVSSSMLVVSISLIVQDIIMEKITMVFERHIMVAILIMFSIIEKTNIFMKMNVCPNHRYKIKTNTHNRNTLSCTITPYVNNGLSISWQGCRITTVGTSTIWNYQIKTSIFSKKLEHSKCSSTWKITGLLL